MNVKMCPRCEMEFGRPQPDCEDCDKVIQQSWQTEESETTGEYWDCPNCYWQAREARIDFDDWKMHCPECDTVLADGGIKENLDR